MARESTVAEIQQILKMPFPPPSQFPVSFFGGGEPGLGIPDAESGCTFPEEWYGRWFQSGITDLVTVNGSEITSKGFCIEKNGDKFLVHDTLTYIRNQLEAAVERESIRVILGTDRRHFRSHVAVTESKKKRGTDGRVFEQAQARVEGLGKKLYCLCVWSDEPNAREMYCFNGRKEKVFCQSPYRDFGDRYRLQLMRLSRAFKEKRPLYAQRHDKVILLHDNARPHVAKPVKTYLETLKWEVLPHPLYSPDIAPSEYHLFRSLAHGLCEQKFTSYEDCTKWFDSWISSKDEQFFRRGIHSLPERWSKVVESNGKYFY
ncbi:MOS1T transposase, partial [Pseudoatta argentina]